MIIGCRFGVLLSELAKKHPGFFLKNQDGELTQDYDYSNPAMRDYMKNSIKDMREGIADAYFLGCSAVFGPTFGFVDGLRTGGDINTTFEFYTSRCLQNGEN